MRHGQNNNFGGCLATRQMRNTDLHQPARQRRLLLPCSQDQQVLLQQGQREAEAGAALARDQDCLWEWCHRLADKEPAARLILRHLGV